MDSLERAFDALLALEGATQDTSWEACALLEDWVPTGGPRNADRVVREAPSEAIVTLLFPARLENACPRRRRGLDRLVLNSLVNMMKWDQPLTDTSVPGHDAAQLIIGCWNPFNKRDTYVANIRDLYPTNLHISVVALFEEYSLSSLGYLDKKSYQCVVVDEMYLHNHDFNETAKLVWFVF